MDQSACFDHVLVALHCEEPDRVPPAEIWIDQGNQGYGTISGSSKGMLVVIWPNSA